MYGKPALGPLQTATGVSLLPATGDSKVLFIIAASLIATGVAIMVASAVVARKSRTSVAK
jgi:LPXTG-motif cell wall-anchored protein